MSSDRDVYAGAPKEAPKTGDSPHRYIRGLPFQQVNDGHRLTTPKDGPRDFSH